MLNYASGEYDYILRRSITTDGALKFFQAHHERLLSGIAVDSSNIERFEEASRIVIETLVSAF